MIPDGVIDEIRGRVDIVAVLGRHVELKRSGRTWKGCCPFHGERTPSFHVYPEDGHFKCYGCGEYGDVFKFLQKLQGKEFPEVVRALATEVGVEIPEREEDSSEQRRKRAERNEALAACDAAARYFAARLASRFGEPARTYLASRGIDEATQKLFRLGVASSAWDDVAPRLAAKNVSVHALEKAGLVARKQDGRHYDRFRGRLMIPIAAADGEVIGFGGRLLPGASDTMAKYINSPESPVYKKSRVLYGIDHAREHIRKTRTAVLVEGYFDVIGLHQSGVRNAIAVCGTALTPEHVDALRRLDCRTITLLFDGDSAGVAAAAKAAPALLPSGIMGKVALLPCDAGKSDPDEYARAHGGAAIDKLVEDAPRLTTYLIDSIVAKYCGQRPTESSYEQKLGAFRELKPLIDIVPAGLARSLFEEQVAKKLGIPLPQLSAETGTAVPMPAPDLAAFARQHSGATRAETQASSSTNSTGPAVDALGILASFPTLSVAAEDERFIELFVGLPVEAIARQLLEGLLDGDTAAARLVEHLPSKAIARFRELQGQARPDPEQAERQFRLAVVRAKIEQLEVHEARLDAEVAGKGSYPPADLVTARLVAARRLVDLKKRLLALERG